jgi:hypothetical protein
MLAYDDILRIDNHVSKLLGDQRALEEYNHTLKKLQCLLRQILDILKPLLHASSDWCRVEPVD